VALTKPLATSALKICPHQTGTSSLTKSQAMTCAAGQPPLLNWRGGWSSGQVVTWLFLLKSFLNCFLVFPGNIFKGTLARKGLIKRLLFFKHAFTIPSSGPDSFNTLKNTLSTTFCRLLIVSGFFSELFKNRLSPTLAGPRPGTASKAVPGWEPRFFYAIF